MDPSNRRQFRREVSRKVSTMISWGIYKINITNFINLFFFDFILFLFYRNEPVSTPSVGTKLEGLLMDEFEEDFNPRAYETAANGLTNHQSNNNSLLNGQVSSGSNFFSQSNGTISPPPLCKYLIYKNKCIFHYR